MHCIPVNLPVVAWVSREIWTEVVVVALGEYRGVRWWFEWRGQALPGGLYHRLRRAEKGDWFPVNRRPPRAPANARHAWPLLV